MKNKRVKWGVLGYARIARTEVIPAILASENSDLHAVASRYPDKIDECKKLFQCEKTYLSYDKLLDDPDVQAVYIPLPNSLHKEWTIKALRSGKHVLCEKPLAMNVEECKEMIKASNDNKRLLMEAFMYRYTYKTKKVLEILSADIVGEIRYIQSTYRFLLDRTNTIKERIDLGGGSLYDVGCYPVNFIGMILNEIPISYKAECFEKHGVDISFSGILRYKSGVIASINSGFDSHKRMSSEIVGTKGYIVIPETFGDDKGYIQIVTPSEEIKIDIPECNRYMLEIFNFSNAILTTNDTNLLSLQESLRNTEVLENLIKVGHQ